MAKSKDNLGIWWINSLKNYSLSIYDVLGIYMDSGPSLQNKVFVLNYGSWTKLLYKLTNL